MFFLTKWYSNLSQLLRKLNHLKLKQSVFTQPNLKLGLALDSPKFM